MKYGETAIEHSKKLQTALQLSIWAINLKALIKEKRRSITKLSEECNWQLYNLDINAFNKARETNFMIDANRGHYKKYDQLKHFLDSENTDLWKPPTGHRENILNKLECWKVLPDGRSHFYHVDTERIFPPLDKAINTAKEEGWIEQQPVSKLYHLTRTGSKLPKVKYLIKNGGF